MNKPLIHLVIALVLLVGAVGAYVFWYMHVTALRGEVAALTAQATTAEVGATEISAARAQLSTLAADEAFFSSYFVSTSTLVSYLEHVEATGRSLGSDVEIVSVTPGGKNDTRISVSFKAVGSFAAVMRTIGAIEYGAYDAYVTSITIDTNAASEGDWSATGAISVGMGPSAPKAPEPEQKPVADDTLI